MTYFETIFHEEAEDFVAALDRKTIKKVLYNIDIAKQTKDPKLFKKLEREIWEYKSDYLLFGTRKIAKKQLVLATHGFVKKTDKVPKKEINKAAAVRTGYFESKKNKKIIWLLRKCERQHWPR
ncbi:type II toxin-antitoxin system RelE/ParE family toxin [Anditalea andensis]|uniref:Toxin RelE n=1 Tax=Anditalea andensis TaxID=1048983 RepID=A0A074KPF4_9BACT|nr:type II toxin-antitoxin system RelE/ParE family toxin [Anditalea andensis]KEO71841.1 toxin RelE [Anditalea andensis]